MMKRLRKSSLVRSFTDDGPGLRRLRNLRVNKIKKKKKKNRWGDDGTASTEDSEEVDQTIRWERTASGRMCKEEQRPSYRPTAQELRQAKLKALPNTAAFSNNLILVNRERIYRGKEPLARCRHLDEIAKKHAEEMAQTCQLLENPINTATMAENVQRGPSIRLIHQMIMIGVSDKERDNILSERFKSFGVGTAKGEDGMIYISQLFQETAARRTPTDATPNRAAIKRCMTT